jgi:hypothetical protein
VSTAIALALIVLAFGACTWAGRRLPGPGRWIPHALLSAALFAAAFETARFDHGYTDAVFAVSFVAAPLVAIFAGSAWGSARFYGWPNFGPTAGWAALAAFAVIGGTLTGSRTAEHDLERSQRTAVAVRERLHEWRGEHGTWPPDLEAVGVVAPRSSMGALNPPPIVYEPGSKPTLSFAISGARRVILDVDTGRWWTPAP